MCVMDPSNFGLSILYSPSDKCQTGSYIVLFTSASASPQSVVCSHVCLSHAGVKVVCPCLSLSVCDFLFYFVTPLSHVNCVQFRFPCLNIPDLFPLFPAASASLVILLGVYGPSLPLSCAGMSFCAPCSKPWLQCRRWKEKVQVHFSSILVALYCNCCDGFGVNDRKIGHKTEKQKPTRPGEAKTESTKGDIGP